MSQTRLIQLEADIMAKNAIFATANRDRFSASGILALNLVSSPGSGKTTLLCRTLTEIAGEFPVAVIEGDQQTSADADRIRATGAPAIQINTGKGCHLDGHMVGHAVEHLAPAEGSVLFIENVGNLVPAAFDLGEGACGDPFRHRGRGQTAQISRYVCQRRSGSGQQGRSLPHLDFDIDLPSPTPAASIRACA
jgi:hydrogenase nickel incorporation protein HypB